MRSLNCSGTASAGKPWGNALAPWRANSSPRIALFAKRWAFMPKHSTTDGETCVRLAASAARRDEHAATAEFAQERVHGQNSNRAVLKRTIAEIDAVTAGRCARAVQVRERPAVLRPPSRARLYLDPDGVPTAGPDEIHLRTGSRPIVRELAPAARVRDLRAQLVKHE